MVSLFWGLARLAHCGAALQCVNKARNDVCTSLIVPQTMKQMARRQLASPHNRCLYKPISLSNCSHNRSLRYHPISGLLKSVYRNIPGTTLQLSAAAIPTMPNPPKTKKPPNDDFRLACFISAFLSLTTLYPRCPEEMSMYALVSRT